MEHKKLIVEFLVNQDPVVALLDEFMAVYFEPDKIWISGACGRYAWSPGSTMGMSGEGQAVGESDPLAAAMHQGNVAACFNQNAGLHVSEVRYVNGSVVFRVAKTSLLGPGSLVDLLWNKETNTFEACGPVESGV
ncbi:MAG: hypothetical protein ACYSW0_18655 [Planctomycetota bacterium]|jgi:hypothetical protein